MASTGNGGSAASSGAAWNWTALSKQAVARNMAHAEQRQTEVSQRVKAAASAVRRAAAAPKTTVKVTAAPLADTHRPVAPLAHPNAETESFSGLRIADRKVAAADLVVEMDGRKFIPLRRMDEISREVLCDDQVDWVTIGVVARKTLSKATANGSSFMVWALSDLSNTELAVFLFDGAYERHWKAVEGSIVAVLHAPLMPASEKNKFALKVSKPEEIVPLGRAVDYGICKGTTNNDVRCRQIVNTAKSHYCLHHIASSFVAAGKRRQQLNNSFSTFNKSMFSSKSQLKNISAGVYGVRPTPGSAVVGRGPASDGWYPITSGSKRKRPTAQSGASSSAILGVPTVISSTGAVAQRPAPSPTSSKKHATTAALLRGQSSAVAEMTGPRASRGHKIIASMLAKTGNATTVLRPNKGKKIDMIKFMTSGNKS